MSRLIKKNISNKALLQWNGRKDFNSMSKKELKDRMERDLNSLKYGIALQRFLSSINPTALKKRK